MRQGFEGYMQFNDLPYVDRVGVFATPLGLHFSPQDKHGILRRRVGIHPMPASTLVQDAETMRAGFYYSVEGTDVGACSESIGHPGDGEFLVRQILQFTIAAKYTYDFLTLGVTGKTAEGREIHRGVLVELPNAQLPQAWTFRIEARIPRESIAEALQLPEREKYGLYERLDRLRDAV